ALPLRVEVGTAGIDRIAYRSDPEAAPLVVDTIRVALAYRDTSLVIHGLDASGPTLGMRGSADIETEGRYATRASLEWRVVLGDAMPNHGELSGTGGLDALVVRVDVEHPYTLDAELVVRNVIERPAIDGTIRGRLEPAAAGWETPVADASTEISLAGPIDELAFDARGGVDLREIAELRIATTGRWLGDALDLEAL